MKPSRLLFGTAGIPKSSNKSDSINGIGKIRELGLDCMELEFVRGVRMQEETANAVRRKSLQDKIRLSVHAPYYINLNSAEPEKVQASKDRIYESARIGELCGAKDIVFHTAYYHKDNIEKVYEKIDGILRELIYRLDSEGIDVTLRPETMGKKTQFGNIEEILRLSSENYNSINKNNNINILPCIDFAHLHARSGGEENSYDHFASYLELVERKLGAEGVNNMHMHVSGIEYSGKGERRHLNLDDSDLRYVELLRALKDFSVKGLLICESPDNENDALKLKDVYSRL